MIIFHKGCLTALEGKIYLMLPKIINCPWCNKTHFVKLNGIQFENNFKSLQEYTIKKRLRCSKCDANLAILTHNQDGRRRVIWESYYQIFDDQFEPLKELQDKKEYILKTEANPNGSLTSVLDKIRDIENQIRADQAKIRIKQRLQCAPSFSAEEVFHA